MVDHLPLKHAGLARQIFDVGLCGRMRALLLLYLQLLGCHLRLKMGLLPYRLVSLGLCDLCRNGLGLNGRRAASSGRPTVAILGFS